MKRPGIPRLSAASLWVGCFAIAAGIHVAGAAALMTRWSEPAEPMPGGAVVLVELAPVTAAPTPVERELPPAPQQIDSAGEIEPVKEAVKEEKVDPAPEPIEEVKEKEPDEVQTAAIVQEPDPVPAIDPELLVMPKPKPPEPEKAPKKTKQASLASAPSASDRKARRETAPTIAATRDPGAISSWRARLAAQLERAKRYPSEARSRGDQGTAHLSFSIDRSGGVHRARIARSSGSAILDRETLALISRAQPLPAPPPELGASISITVPIRYTMR